MLLKLHEIIKHFQLSGSIKQILPVEIGHINQTYKVVVEKSSVETGFILQRINHFVFKKPAEVMDNIVRVGQHLNGKNYPKKVLMPLPAKNGLYYVRDHEEGYWRLYPFIDNTRSFNEVRTEEMAYKGAFTFGEYLQFLDDFDCRQLHYTIPDFHNTNLRYQDYYFTLKNCSKARLGAAQQCITDLAAYRFLLGPVQKIKLPLRVVHSDTKINNILFDKHSGEAVCVVDLDTLMPGWLIFDYGDMVRTFTPPVDENSECYEEVYIRKNILRALTSGILDGLGDRIQPLEKSLLIYGAKVTIFEQALRFLTDYLKGNLYYKVNREDQNLIRAKNQVVLLKDLEKCTR